MRKRAGAVVLVLGMLVACDDGTSDDDQADAADGAADGAVAGDATGGAADAAGGAADAAAGNADATPTTAIDYGEDGPVPFTVSSHQVTGGGGTVTVSVYLPSTPGPHPAVSFSCGSTQTAAGYVDYGERLASHGIAMFITDDAGVFTNTSDIVPRAAHVVDTWIPATYAGTIDVARIGLAGHSRGGAVSLLAAEHPLKGKVVAWFGLDPVDNQFFVAPHDYARTDLASIGIPTGMLGAEVISNCAPAADGYQMLFPLAPAPKVLVLGLGAGHAQMESQTGCTACGFCSPGGTADPAVVMDYSLRYFAAFFARELLGDATVGAAFEGAGGPDDVAAGLVTIE